MRFLSAHCLGLIVIASLALAGCGGGDSHDHHGHDHKDHGHDHVHDHDHSGPNAHVWLDPVETKKFVHLLDSALTRQIELAAKENRKARFVASIFPIGSLVEEIVGDRAEVRVMLPSGSSPHGFDVTPDVMQMVTRADLTIIVGLGLDGWASKVWQSAHGKSDAGRGELISFQALMGQRLADDAVPPSTRAQAVLDKLDALHKKCEAELAKVKSKELVTFHNAFDLLAARYGLKVVAHLTEMDLPTGSEVTPGALKEAKAAVKKHNLRVLYAEPQYPDSALKAIQEATGVAILKLDDLGGPDRPGYRTYFEMMESNLKMLVDGQSK